MQWKDIGWESYASTESPDPSYARVASVAHDRFLVWTEHSEIEATVSGHLRYLDSDFPCVGDWVVLRPGNVIQAVLPRRTKLSRKEPGSTLREQILAANIDLIFIVSGLDQDYNPRRLERYLVVARDSGARPVILLNKADLQGDAEAFVRLTARHDPSVPVFAISALEKRGLESIPQQLAPGETAALLGSSGAGKSTIVNGLLANDRQRTNLTRIADGRGRHTTTRRELIPMPGGWLLMDFPGLREIQLWTDTEQVDTAFPEIIALAESCRFRDCTHTEEPGCAVRSADLAPARLASYQKLKREVEFLKRQANPHLARETRKKWNALEKQLRRHPKRTRP
jgi:ribosome biogenesis GTPase / thiamine phosphate phosphatase